MVEVEAIGWRWRRLSGEGGGHQGSPVPTAPGRDTQPAFQEARRAEGCLSDTAKALELALRFCSVQAFCLCRQQLQALLLQQEIKLISSNWTDQSLAHSPCSFPSCLSPGELSGTLCAYQDPARCVSLSMATQETRQCPKSWPCDNSSLFWWLCKRVPTPPFCYYERVIQDKLSS